MREYPCLILPAGAARPQLTNFLPMVRYALKGADCTYIVFRAQVKGGERCLTVRACLAAHLIALADKIQSPSMREQDSETPLLLPNLPDSSIICGVTSSWDSKRSSEDTERHGTGYRISRKPLPKHGDDLQGKTESSIQLPELGLPEQNTDHHNKKVRPDDGILRTVLHVWWLELILCILCVGSLIAIVATIYPYNGLITFPSTR